MGKDLSGSGRGLIDVLNPYVWRAPGKPRRTSVRISNVPVEIRTEFLPNASLERYCYTNLLGPNDSYQMSTTFILTEINSELEPARGRNQEVDIITNCFM
jgi:hypothetical protein